MSRLVENRRTGLWPVHRRPRGGRRHRLCRSCSGVILAPTESWDLLRPGQRNLRHFRRNSAGQACEKSPQSGKRHGGSKVTKKKEEEAERLPARLELHGLLGSASRKSFCSLLPIVGDSQGVCVGHARTCATPRSRAINSRPVRGTTANESGTHGIVPRFRLLFSCSAAAAIAD